MEKPVTVVISDLHIGGGPGDPGDDHVYDRNQLERLIREELGGSPRGKAGQIELFINGDLFELAQVRPELYRGGHYYSWSSESESVERLEVILDGHAGIFAALGDFQKLGNGVTLAAGNHDVDLYWPAIQARLRRAAGPVEFALGEAWYARHRGRLQIAHGHMDDPANRFKNWSRPILTADGAEPRLEMCPGTLFMLKFVNPLEAQYPFVDNIKPVTALARLLWRENKKGFSAVAWLFMRFGLEHPDAALGVRKSDPADFHRRLKRLAEVSPELRGELRALASEVYGKAMSDQDTVALLATEVKLAAFMMDALRRGGLEKLAAFTAAEGGTLSQRDQGTLAIAKSGAMDEKTQLQKVAETRFMSDKSCEVIVMGHTHQPHTWRQDGRVYYNPGSWTRYVEVPQQDKLTLESLRDESAFPYQLNYVRVEDTGAGPLASEMKVFEQQSGKPKGKAA